MCRVLRVHLSGYHACLLEPMSPRAKTNEKMIELIGAVFVKKVVRFSKRIPPRFLATSDAPAAGLATPL